MPSLARRFGFSPQQFRPAYCSFSIKPNEDHFTTDVFNAYSRKVAHIRFHLKGKRFQAECDCLHGEPETGCEHIHSLLKELDRKGFRWPAAKMALSSFQQAENWDSLWERTERDVERRTTGAASVRLQYVVDVQETVNDGKLVLEVWNQRRTKVGGWSKPRQQTLRDTSNVCPNDADVCRFFQSLVFNRPQSAFGYADTYSVFSPMEVPSSLQTETLRKICRTGRCRLRKPGDPESPLELPILQWNDAPWEVGFRVAEGDEGWRLSGQLQRGEETHPANIPVLFLSSGLVFLETEAAPFTPPDAFPWIALFRRKHDHLDIPRQDTKKLIERLQKLPHSLFVDAPKDFEYSQTEGLPRGCLQIGALPRGERTLPVALTFEYDGQRVSPEVAGPAHIDHDQRRLLLRNPTAEQQLYDQLDATVLQLDTECNFRLAPDQLTPLVDQLADQGWTIEAEGKRLRRSGNFNIRVTSEVDWFDVEAGFDFDGEVAPLPKILSAMRRGEGYVVLDDGSRGLLPEQWLQDFGSLAQLGESAGDSLRFSSSQALLLDALLAAQDNAKTDAKFKRFRDKLRRFEGVGERKPPATFHGELRGYQREGLGWMKFLSDFHLGGCLADDMGLGKTVQVLALLEARRRRRRPASGAARKPSLVVAPRSLLFNWLNEAARFAPNLKSLRYFGTDRESLRKQFTEADLIVTTFGIVRRDIQHLRKTEFDYVVLDEAQSIKNASAQAAKACRLLNGDHRLALTGTPVENHLGELWSIFEFLNPGMLGRSQAFDRLAREARDNISSSRELLAKAVRPYVLRRTKQQVLKELPEKLEQTIQCEMGNAQRKAYDELRAYYQTSLTSKVSRKGLANSKIHVLEALLRLRQAACDPRLIDPSAQSGSVKLDTLMEHLRETTREGHKTLVFSQFTKLLRNVRQRLDDDHVTYEYLDGRTRDREARVNRFQEDEKCPVFLISLKAGGNGLNLTAADYVFILDPWWNPAVEAQAIDRAHRIGQDKKVFAYRLICKNTVEEKILELQARKRELAEAIITTNNSVMRDLTAEDLQLLLS